MNFPNRHVWAWCSAGVGAGGLGFQVANFMTRLFTDELPKLGEQVFRGEPQREEMHF